MKLATVSAIVLFGLMSSAYAAGYWIPNGSRPLNPASLGTTCYYYWSTNVNLKTTKVVGPFTLCPISP
jgi:hypothetical protein